MEHSSQDAVPTITPRLGMTGESLRTANATITKLTCQVISLRDQLAAAKNIIAFSAGRHKIICAQYAEIEQLRDALALSNGQIDCLQQIISATVVKPQPISITEELARR
jgi:hypothetical protein